MPKIIDDAATNRMRRRGLSAHALDEGVAGNGCSHSFRTAHSTKRIMGLWFGLYLDGLEVEVEI